MFPYSVQIFALICVSGVLSHRISCDIEDYKCVTKTGNHIYSQLITGVSGVESSDPLREQLIEGNVSTVSFKYTNIAFSGMKKCHVFLLKFARKDSKYEAHLSCPHLTLDSECEVKGKIDSVFVKGKGTCSVNLYDYRISLIGTYQIKNDANGNEHLFVEHLDINSETKGKTEYEYKSALDNCDDKKAFTNEHWQIVEKLTKKIILTTLMKKYTANLNAYLDIVPAKIIFTI